MPLAITLPRQHVVWGRGANAPTMAPEGMAGLGFSKAAFFTCAALRSALGMVLMSYGLLCLVYSMHVICI
jgi:hypothetical protein